MKFSCLIVFCSLFSSAIFATEKATDCILSAQITEQHYQNSKEPGLWHFLHLELLELLANTANCKLQLVKVPWSRGLSMLQEGQLDLMMTMSKSKEREQFADFIGSHYVEEAVLVLHKDYQTRTQTLADVMWLPGQIGVLREAFYGEEYQRLQQNPDFAKKLLDAKTISHKLGFLERNRVLGVIEDRAQYQEWAKKHPDIARLYSEHLVVNRNPVYFAASRSGMTQQQRDHLRQSWAKVYGSEAHMAILAKYGWSLQLE